MDFLIQFYGTDALIIVISIGQILSVSLIPNLARTKSQRFQIFKTLRTLYSVNFISIIGFIIVSKNIICSNRK